jgi:hypothetical protein
LGEGEEHVLYDFFRVGVRAGDAAGDPEDA